MKQFSTMEQEDIIDCIYEKLSEEEQNDHNYATIVEWVCELCDKLSFN